MKNFFKKLKGGLSENVFSGFFKPTPTPEPTPARDMFAEKGWTKAGGGYFMPSKEGGYAFLDKEKIPQDILAQLGEAPAVTPSPLPKPSVPPYQAYPTQQPSEQVPSLDTNTLTNMINVYGGKDAPLHKYASQLADATKYDFWKNNSELLALIPHLETTSGRWMTKPASSPNSLMNYGIKDPYISKLFTGMPVEEVLTRSLKEIGETGNVYKKFRTGKTLTDEELMELAKTYEPANSDYGPNLVEGRKHIRKTMGWPEL